MKTNIVIALLLIIAGLLAWAQYREYERSENTAEWAAFCAEGDRYGDYMARECARWRRGERMD